MNLKDFTFILLAGILLVACAPAATAVPTPAVIPTATLVPASTETLTPILPTSTLTPTDSPTPTATSTATPTITPTSTATLVPAATLRGIVLEHSSCRYGPGVAYIYKYGLNVDTRMEAIGRDADGDWLFVQGIGGSNPCWLKASLMKVDGDVMHLPDAYPIPSHLPISPYFPPIVITRISSDEKDAGKITIEWQDHEISKSRGLSTQQGVEYIIEVWTCVDGKPAFFALGFGENVTIGHFQIDNSCGLLSHADMIGEDKEGFSYPSKINLPNLP